MELVGSHPSGSPRAALSIAGWAHAVAEGPDCRCWGLCMAVIPTEQLIVILWWLLWWLKQMSPSVRPGQEEQILREAASSSHPYLPPSLD